MLWDKVIRFQELIDIIGGDALQYAKQTSIPEGILSLNTQQSAVGVSGEAKWGDEKPIFHL